MNRLFPARLFFYLFIIALWGGVIFLFLYSPLFVQLVRRQETLNILAWPQVLDAHYLKKFEQETGIKVNISYFEHNEELFVKLKLTQQHDYDLIMPSDYAVQLLIEEGLLKKIDRTQLDFWEQLYPALLGHYFDPFNDYTIPFYWTPIGLGIDRDYFNGKLPPASWSLLFDEHITPNHISVFDDARELPLIAAQYLFGSLANIDKEKFEKIKKLLVKQKSWVELYTDSRSEYILASKTSPVVMVYGADLVKVMRPFKNLDFLIPQEGSFVLIDSFAIPATTTKNESIYKFLNYLYNPAVLSQYVEKFDFFPPTKTVVMDERFKKMSIPTKALFKKLHFFKSIIPEKMLNDLWIAVKS